MGVVSGGGSGVGAAMGGLTIGCGCGWDEIFPAFFLSSFAFLSGFFFPSRFESLIKGVFSSLCSTHGGGV